MGTSGSAPDVTREEIRSIFAQLDEPHTPLTTAEVAENLDRTDRTARRNLEALAELGELQARQIDDRNKVWWRSGDTNELAGQQPELQEFGAFVSAVEDYAIFMLDPDGTVVSWNEGAERIKGYSESEIVGEHVSTFYTGEDADAGAPEQNLETAAREGRVEDEGWRVRKDGSRFWAHVVITAVRDDDGGLRGYTKVTRDITERTERERELTKYETIVETVNDGIYVKDEAGQFTMVNEAYAEMTGYDREELVGEHASLVVDEDAMEQSRELETEATDGASHDPTVEAMLQTADGNEVPAEGTFATFETNDDTRKHVGVVRDITERREQRRRIEESERRYRTLVENFPNGSVGLFDDDLRYTAIGGQITDSLGVDPEERVGNTISELHPDALVAKIEPYFHAALDGETNSFEVEFEDRHLDAHALPVRNADDDISAGMLVVQDVTERREIEEELRESEAKFRQMAEHLEQVIWMTTDDQREVLYVNPAFEEVYGRDREEVYEDADVLLESVHPEDREMVIEELDKGVTDEYEIEYRIVKPDGEVRWIHDRATPIFDDDGDVYRIVGDANDITERKEREQRLERALDLLERTERIADVGGWEIDTETMDVFWTDHIFDLLEVDADEEPPLDEALDMYHEEDQSIVEDAVENALDSGDPFDVEVRIRTSGGEIRWLRLQGVPETVDDDVVSFRGAAQDVTERKQREQRLGELIERLEESNERLEQFAYAASHDLQEPLRMVSSYLRLIEERYGDELDEDGEEFLEFAVDGADRMRNMIEGLLQYSRVETQGDDFEPVDLDAVLADVRADLQVRIEETDAEIAADSLPRVDGDEEQLRQVFQNLLDNAIEYSGDEPPQVDISAERNGAEWVVSVSDEGIGIDPDDADRVFDVFQSLHAPDDHAGTGIGLALVKRIVERHGGDIWIDSEPGKGATFTFTLPVQGEHSD